MKGNGKFFKYFKEYRWSNVLAMIKNNGRDPRICPEDCQDKRVLITGATTGIGYWTARKYASRGASLLCINRDPGRSEALRREIESDYGVGCDHKIADLSRLRDIRRVAEEVAADKLPIDVLIHNAGAYLTRRELTPDGMERVFVIQYLSSFMINYVLMDKLRSQDKARIIMVNSEGHRFAAWGLRLDDMNWERRRYSGLRSYGSAKLAQLLSMIVFNERFRRTGVTINAMHPGAVKTETGRENGPVYRWLKRHIIDRSLKSPQLSAEALYYLGVSEEVEAVSGRFFNLTTQEEPAPPALDEEVAHELWEKSLGWCGLKGTHS